ncbi:family 43 glycosylhydrolase [Nonomuraea diastatica]|uniref:Hydrolase n=1 Tax=Nonomuraea diastatica TaxID=1848329 RepID=A0A4R4WNG0_9ACTN|nr:family 43 glycosylhydrolase [Nonomuraea diastatica]TDD18223.1 hydrolase [Nonomuraea diastatica]
MIRRAMAALALLLLALVVPGTGPASAATSYTNPIKSQKGADPWLQYHDGNYYLITTSFTNTLVIRKSPTLGGLNTAPSIQVWQDTTSSRGTNFWAPELHLINGRWYIYYSAGQVGSTCCDSQRTHVLESAGSDPLGPYTYRNILTGGNLDPGGWLIDASPMTLNGSLYLLGSGFIGGSAQSLVIARMSNPYTVSGTFSRISSPTHSWETQGGTVNEAPVALQRGGRTFVIYSASACWGPDYKLGQLTYNGGDPLSASAWAKRSTPVFQRAGSVYGPGHNGFFTSPDGQESWIVYHANSSTSGGCDNNRTTRAQKFTWNADGTPNLGTPVATGAALPAPAGESAATPAGYTLVNRNSGKCLEVSGGSSSDGANIQQWTCGGGANQRWRVEDQADDTSRLVNVATGKVVDVADCASADGTGIRQWSWLDNTCQRFRLVYTASGGWVRIVNAATGKVADVADCGTADGADVRQWSWLDNTCQQWSLRPAQAYR